MLDLNTIFEMQDNLNKRFGWDQESLMKLTEEERLNRIRRYLEVMIIEGGEAQKAAKARWWKEDKDWLGWDHLKTELIDSFHFLVSAYLATGGTAKEFFDTYVNKNEFNHKRSDWQINEQTSSTQDNICSSIKNGTV